MLITKLNVMERSIKDLLLSEISNGLNLCELDQSIQSIKEKLAKWKFLYESQSVVKMVSDFTENLPPDYLIEVDVFPTFESFNEPKKFTDKVSIYIDVNANVFLDRHSLENTTEGSTEIFEKWTKEYCPDDCFPEDFGFSKLYEALQKLGNIYRQSIPEPVNSNS
jgi:hypothetical protein